MLIGVVGGERASPDSLQLAYEVGAELAARGHTLICGGRGGVMLESCRGAKSQRGLTVGILSGEDATDANEFVDVPIITAMGFIRNAIIARSAEALIAIDGSYGTLSEIAFALIAGRTVVGLGTWELRDGDGVEPPLVRVTTAREALDACERAVAGEG